VICWITFLIWFLLLDTELDIRHRRGNHQARYLVPRVVEVVRITLQLNVSDELLGDRSGLIREQETL